MERKAISGKMLTLLFIGMLTLAFNMQSVKTDQKAQLLLETDKDVYILGENVTITLKNIGSETIHIGGYPAWQIYAYPEEEPVYPKIFAFLAWSLEPGQNDTITWKQYNEFTQSPTEPRMYVLRDTQGWGLSAYLEIVSAEEQWIPYVPLPDQVDLEFWIEDQVAYVEVSVTFYDAGYNVSDWGDVVKDGYEIWADSEIWDWTGPAALVITTLCHIYNLGELEHGTYTFTFKAWSLPVESIVFTIPPLPGDTDGDFDVDLDDLYAVLISYGLTIDHSDYVPCADMDGDGIVDIDDLYLVLVNYEEIDS